MTVADLSANPAPEWGVIGLTALTFSADDFIFDKHQASEFAALQ